MDLVPQQWWANLPEKKSRKTRQIFVACCKCSNSWWLQCFFVVWSTGNYSIARDPKFQPDKKLSCFRVCEVIKFVLWKCVRTVGVFASPWPQCGPVLTFLLPTANLPSLHLWQFCHRGRSPSHCFLTAPLGAWLHYSCSRAHSSSRRRMWCTFRWSQRIWRKPPVSQVQLSDRPVVASALRKHSGLAFLGAACPLILVRCAKFLRKFGSFFWFHPRCPPVCAHGGSTSACVNACLSCLFATWLALDLVVPQPLCAQRCCPRWTQALVALPNHHTSVGIPICNIRASSRIFRTLSSTNARSKRWCNALSLSGIQFALFAANRNPRSLLDVGHTCHGWRQCLRKWEDLQRADQTTIKPIGFHQSHHFLKPVLAIILPILSITKHTFTLWSFSPFCELCHACWTRVQRIISHATFSNTARPSPRETYWYGGCAVCQGTPLSNSFVCSWFGWVFERKRFSSLELTWVSIVFPSWKLGVLAPRRPRERNRPWQDGGKKLLHQLIARTKNFEMRWWVWMTVWEKTTNVQNTMTMQW